MLAIALTNLIINCRNKKSAVTNGGNKNKTVEPIPEVG